MARRRGGLLLGLGMLALLLVALLLWWGRPASPDAVRTNRATPPDEIEAELPSRSREGDAPIASLPRVAEHPEAPTAIADPAASATRGSLLVRVRWEADRSPATDIGLNLLQWDGPSPLFHIVEGRTDSRGEWRLDDASPGRVTAYSDRSESESGDIVAGQINVLELELPPGIWVRGEVIDSSGRAVPHATIWLSDYGTGTEGKPTALADEAGRFELRGVGDGHYVGAQAPGHMASPIHFVPRGESEMFFTLVLGPPGGALRGRVLSPDGAPVAGAIILVGPEYGWPPPDRYDQLTRQGAPPIRLTSDSEGRFAVSDLPPGNVPLAVRGEGWSPCARLVPVQVSETSEVEVQLQPGAIVTGTVRDGSGQPVAGAEVSSGEYGGMQWVCTTSGEDGRYELVGMGSPDIRAFLDGVGRDSTTLGVRAGASAEWDPVLSLGLQVFGRIADSAGAVIGGLFVNAEEPEGSWHGGAQADDAGRFVLSNCPVGPITLTVHDLRSDPPVFSLAIVPDVMPGPGEVLVTVPVERALNAWVAGRVEYADGRPATDVDLYLQPKGSNSVLRAPLDAQGDFRGGPSLPGDYRLQVRPRGCELFTIEDLVLQAEQTLDLGVIVVEETGLLVLHATIAADVTEANVQLWLHSDARKHLEIAERQIDGSYASSLAAGAYELRIHGNFVGSRTIPFSIEPGRTTELTASIERGVLCGIRVELPYDPAHEPAALARVLDASGGLVVESQLQLLDWPDTQRREVTRGIVLSPGSYRFQLLLDGEQSLETPMEVPDVGAEVARFDWHVPR